MDYSYIKEVYKFLNCYYSKYSGMSGSLWNISEKNTFDADWLLVTPTDVFGKNYDQFKQEVFGNKTSYRLAECTVDDKGGQCVALQSTCMYPSDTPQKLLVGHSYRIYDEIYKLMVSAEKFLDITTLTIPTGQFFIAMQNAITYLSHKPEDKRPIMRILYSNPLPDILAPNEPAKDFLKEVTQYVNPRDKLEIYVGILSSSFTSWNHSKIVAADGVRVITGGHNLWGSNYCISNPVFDVSMKLSGNAALHAHDYANSLWSYLITLDEVTQRQWISGSTTYRRYREYYNAARLYNSSTDQNECVIPKLPANDIYTKIRRDLGGASEGTVSAIAIGRQADMSFSINYQDLNLKGSSLPNLKYYTRIVPPIASYTDQTLVTAEPSDASILKALSLATKTIKMSLQALRFDVRLTKPEWIGYTAGPYDTAVLIQLAKAMRRGVEVYIILSNRNAIPGGQKWTQALYDGNSPKEINYKFLKVLKDSFKMSESSATKLIETKLFSLSFRYNSELSQSTYPDKSTIGNHAKTFIIDDRLFYIGSQNLYTCNLNEFGFLVEDATIAAHYKDAYWTKLLEACKMTTRISKRNISRDNSEDDEEIEAIYFYLELYRNIRLNKQFKYVKAQREDNSPSSVPQSEKDEYDLGTKIALNSIIANAGFNTTIEAVIEVSNNPLFQDSSVTPNTDSDKFVLDTSTKKDLYQNYASVIYNQKGKSLDEANAAINDFLQNQGYHCTAGQVYSSFQSFRKLVLEYWSGEYRQAWIIADGGAMFDLDNRASSKNHMLGVQLPLPNYPDNMAYVGDTIFIEKNGNVQFAGQNIKNPSFTSGMLTWSSADGNDTNAKITFNEIYRESLSDNFVGYECFGTIVYSSIGNVPRRGKVSYYAKLLMEKTDAQSTFPFGPVFGSVFGILGFLGISYYFFNKLVRAYQRASDQEYNRLNRLNTIIDNEGEDMELTTFDRELYDKYKNNIGKSNNQFEKMEVDSNILLESFSRQIDNLQKAMNKNLEAQAKQIEELAMLDPNDYIVQEVLIKIKTNARHVKEKLYESYDEYKKYIEDYNTTNLEIVLNTNKAVDNFFKQQKIDTKLAQDINKNIDVIQKEYTDVLNKTQQEINKTEEKGFDPDYYKFDLFL